MSEGNRYGVDTATLSRLVQNHVGDAQASLPLARYNQDDDTLEIIFEDCSYFEDSLPGEKIILLRAMYGEPRAIGVRIYNMSRVRVAQSIPGAF